MEHNSANTTVQEVPCESSSVDFMRYDHASKTLQVEFKKGKKYNYADVPPELWNEAIQAESIGSFVNQKIKGKFTTSFTETKLQ